MVAIAVIALLALALIPLNHIYQSRGRDIDRLTTIERLNKGLSLYLSDRGGYPRAPSSGCIDSSILPSKYT